MHNDKVYFQVTNDEKEKIHCKVVHVIKEAR